MRNLLAAVVMALALVACSKSEKAKTGELSVVSADGNKVEYKVELAQTEEEMSKGLMFRDALDEKSGMLFALWKIGEESAMWMKNTKIPLDMLFVDKDGMVYWIYENAEPNSEKLIVAPYAPYAVLEVNAGDVKKYGIKIGDNVKYSWFEGEKTQAVEEEPADVQQVDTVAEPAAVEKVGEATNTVEAAPQSLD